MTPRLRRIVLVVLLSADRRILLECTAGGVWRPLSVEVPAGGSYRATLDLLKNPILGAVRGRVGRVVGRLSMDTGAGGRHIREEYRLFILRLAAPAETLRIRSPMRWPPLTELGDYAVRLFPSDLGVLMEGYVDGWIPDGPITLEP